MEVLKLSNKDDTKHLIISETEDGDFNIYLEELGTNIEAFKYFDKKPKHHFMNVYTNEMEECTQEEVIHCMEHIGPCAEIKEAIYGNIIRSIFAPNYNH